MYGLRIFVGALAGWLCLAGPAPAATIVETATQWGLLGTWAPDCGSPPDSHGNTYITLRVHGDGVMQHRDFGGGGGDDAPLVGAVLDDAGGLTWTVDMDRIGMYEIHYIKNADGQAHSTATRNVGTDLYTVREATFVSSGKPVPWLSLCK